MTSPVTSAQVEAAKALIQEEALTRWQHWRDWITLNQERLKLKKELETADSGYDRDDSPKANQLRENERKLAAIPSELRTEFQAVFAERRDDLADEEQRNGGVPRDSSEIELAVLEHLLALCNGDPITKKGQVPYQGTWFEFDTSALNKVPTAAHYLTGAPSKWRLTMPQLIALVLIVPALVFLVMQLLPRSPIVVDAGEAQQILVNDAAAVTWSPIRLAVQGVDASLPIRLVPRASWPEVAQDSVGWREGSIWPIELCMNREALPATSAQIELASEAQGLARTYQLAADPATLVAPTSLLISACDDAQQLRYGALISSAPQPSVELGEAQALTTGPSITLLEATVVGHAQVAEVPDGKVRVTLLVATDSPVTDWTSLHPTLRLASGETTEPMSDPATRPGSRTALTYLVSAYPSQSAASWQVSDLAMGGVLRWRLTIPVPPSRLAYLDEHLQVDIPQVSRLTSGQFRLAIPMTANVPLTVRYEDLAAHQGTTVVPLPLFSQEDSTLTPGETTTLTIDLSPPELGQELTLSVGRSVFAIAIPEGR